MKNLYFQMQYHTAWGEQIRVCLRFNNYEVPPVMLTTKDGETWHGGAFLPESTDTISYHYEVCTPDGKLLRREPGAERCFSPRHRSSIAFCDTWRLATLSPVVSHTAFTECVMNARGGEAMHEALLDGAALLMLRATPPPKGWRWAVVGSSAALGSWHPERACYLRRTGCYEWGVAIQREDFENGLEYKYIWVSETGNGEVMWEDGPNRLLPHPTISDATAMVHTDEAPQLDAPAWRGAGACIPVFALRSEGSTGCGDFADLARFVRWAAEAGMQAVQILPINDTTTLGSYRDSYPYNAVSVFALHPIYLDPREWADSRAFGLIKAEARQLNALPEMDYEATMRLKLTFLHDIFVEKGAAICAAPSFKTFVAENADWLPDYTMYCRRRDTLHASNHRAWPAESEEERNLPKNKDAERFYAFTQFLLHRQMKRVHDEARALGVMLKGDIPIGVSPDSVETLTRPSLFNLNGRAGAPPDAFAVNGQNWGFPTYNWELMANDNYAWWQRRLQHMSIYFDAYRIDHVLGFFRIWEIPASQVYGTLGHFRPALPLSKDEIKAFGFSASVARYSRPFVSISRFDALQGEMACEDLKRYFTPCDEGYTLKDECATQRAILATVPEGPLQKLLLDVVAEVLFLPDPSQPDLYHPRVAAMSTAVFANLAAADREAFCRLHDNFFYERHNQFWADEAMKKLPVVTHTSPGEEGGMLPCAEDLGMVPASVKGVLEKLNILSLEIQTMPKAFGKRFSDLQDNPYLSVDTIATHDMPPLRLWWKQQAADAEAYWVEVLQHEAPAPTEASASLCEAIVGAHLASPSMLCILSMQDLLAIHPTLRRPNPEEEQINVPANPDQYWRYRLHLTLEQLEAATDFNDQLRALIQKSGRAN